jgi:hypothetical protein
VVVYQDDHLLVRLHDVREGWGVEWIGQSTHDLRSRVNARGYRLRSVNACQVGLRYTEFERVFAVGKLDFSFHIWITPVLGCYK